MSQTTGVLQRPLARDDYTQTTQMGHNPRVCFGVVPGASRLLWEGPMTDVLNMPLHDHELLAEIAMTSDLMIVAAESDGRVPQRAIDAVLQAEAV